MTAPDARQRAGCTSLASGPEAGDLCDSEVEQLHEVGVAVALDEHDVLGLQVAVHDAQRVGRLEAGDDPRAQMRSDRAVSERCAPSSVSSASRSV